MLTHLSIKNFTVVKTLDIEFGQGMTAVTGETGAGKSISLDAISLCLGARGDANMVRQGAERADLIASFDVTSSNTARHWLKENDLDNDSDCIIRRTISAEGRSKAWINGTPVTAQQLKSLGVFLISIHGQHAHQQLLKNEIQRELLDGYSQHPKLLDKVSSSFHSMKSIGKELLELQQAQQQSDARNQLLQYQVNELDEFSIGEDEFKTLEQEFKTLSNSQELLQESSACLDALYQSDFSLLGQLENYQQRLQKLLTHDTRMTPIAVMLGDAAIQVTEASHELRDYVESLDLDPSRISEIEQRYANAMELARKHKVQPEDLYQHHQLLAQELNEISGYQGRIEELQLQAEVANKEYLLASEKLSSSRSKQAKKLAKEIEGYIHKLNMPHAKVVIEVTNSNQNKITALGIDDIEFLLTTNPGQPLQAMQKVASGGELSRIGLAIQVITSGIIESPTLIFDEVDTGISGGTATVVGQMLRELGSNHQVMCVTHLAQVAANAHQQMFVTKFSDGKTTETNMMALDESDRVQELARLLGGDIVTDTAIANAKELLVK